MILDSFSLETKAPRLDFSSDRAMGSFPSRSLQDGISGVSPWMTLVHIDNQTNQPVSASKL